LDVKPKKKRAPAKPKVKPRKQFDFEIDPPVRSSVLYDDAENLIGRYIYLQEDDQELLDNLCRSWLETYKRDANFFLALDLETRGLNPVIEGNEILLHCISWDGECGVVFEHQKFDLTLYREVLNTVPLANHNIKFDAKWLIWHLDVVPIIFWCTMTACQMGWAGVFPKYAGKHFALDNVVRVLLPPYKMSKETRKEFYTKRPLQGFSRKQIEYAVRDAILTYKLVKPQYTRLVNYGLMELWEEIELPLIKMFTYTELFGIDVDVEFTYKIFEQKEVELSALREEINRKILELPADVRPPVGPDGKYNPGSWQQLAKILNAIGVKVPNTEKDTLSDAYADNPHPVLKDIIDFKVLSGQISKLLKRICEEYMDLPSRKIYPSSYTHGTETARFSMVDPPLLTASEWIRPMVIAPPGWKILDRDYSAFEFRACAAKTREKRLLDLFAERARILPEIKDIVRELGGSDPDDFCKKLASGKLRDLKITDTQHQMLVYFSTLDIHKVNGSGIFGIPTDKITDSQRQVAKCVALDTLVHTEQGIVPLISLLPKRRKADTFYPVKGLSVWSDTELKSVDQVYYQGKAPALRVTTESGRQITCSKPHQFRTLDKKQRYAWIKAQDIKQGTPVICAFNGKLWGGKKYKSPAWCKDHEQLIWLYAQYLRSGYVDEQQRLCLPQLAPEELRTWIKQNTTLKASCKMLGKYHGAVLDTPELCEWLRQPVLVVLQEIQDPICLRILLRTWAVQEQGQWFIYHSSKNVLRWVQNVIGRLGINCRLRAWGEMTRLTFSDRDARNLTNYMLGRSLEWDTDMYCTWVYTAPPAIRQKLADWRLENTVTHNTCGMHEAAQKFLTKYEYETMCFLLDNRLRVELVSSVQDAGIVELGDLSVPDGHTLNYEGLITHNTLGYAVLYGSGVPQIRSQLAAKGHIYTQAECQKFYDAFFSSLPAVKKFIEEVHRMVKDGGYIETNSGRKRFFSLPPKYMRTYNREKAACEREAVNYFFQAGNADAQKPAIVMLHNRWERFPADCRPRTIINFHDAIVALCPDEYVEEVFEEIGRMMIEWGDRVVEGLVPIEVSGNIYNRSWKISD
jgi:DNA polymerase I-like protein with 3'-5' exonuclease and polymerase domains